MKFAIYLQTELRYRNSSFVKCKERCKYIKPVLYICDRIRWINKIKLCVHMLESLQLLSIAYEKVFSTTCLRMIQTHNDINFHYNQNAVLCLVYVQSFYFKNKNIQTLYRIQLNGANQLLSFSTQLHSIKYLSGKHNE